MQTSSARVAGLPPKMETPTSSHLFRNMPIIKIDNKDYEFDNLSAEAKSQVQTIQFVDGEINRFKAQMAVFQTARMAYIKALQAEIDPLKGDTIKLGGAQ